MGFRRDGDSDDACGRDGMGSGYSAIPALWCGEAGLLLPLGCRVGASTPARHRGLLAATPGSGRWPTDRPGYTQFSPWSGHGLKCCKYTAYDDVR
jgi:hypothetical protein